MEDIWSFLGYTGKCGEDGFPAPGELIKKNRMKKNMSQGQLAEELDCSRAMVARMENENLGLSDISTRRKLAKILGIAPIMFGLVLHEDLPVTKPLVLYDTTVLKRSLILHREVYFAGGDVGGIPELDAMVQSIFAISKSLEHKNKEVLTLLCHYGQLGIDIGREEQNYKTVERYGNWAQSIAHKLSDQSLLASTLLRYSSAMYEKGDLRRARQYADEALSQTRIPAQLHGGVLLEASRVYAAMGDPQAMKFLDKAMSIVRRDTQEEDTGFVKLTAGFCHLRYARALYTRKDYGSTLESLDLAEEQTTASMVRRRNGIHILQAQTLLAQGHYYDATLCANAALTMASMINSAPNLAYISLIYRGLRESSFGNAEEVNKLGKSLSQAVGTRKLVLPVQY